MKFSVTSDALEKVNSIHFAIFITVVAVLAIVAFGSVSADEEIEWFIAVTSLLLFAWLNSVLSFFTPNWGRHTFYSILCYFGMAFVLLGTAHLVSTTSILKMEVYQSLVMAITIFFMVAVFISKLIKSIKEFMHLH